MLNNLICMNISQFYSSKHTIDFLRCFTSYLLVFFVHLCTWCHASENISNGKIEITVASSCVSNFQFHTQLFGRAVTWIIQCFEESHFHSVSFSQGRRIQWSLFNVDTKSVSYKKHWEWCNPSGYIWMVQKLVLCDKIV